MGSLVIDVKTVILQQKEQFYKESGFNVVKIWKFEGKIQKNLSIQDPDHIDKNITIEAYADHISNYKIINYFLKIKT